MNRNILMVCLALLLGSCSPGLPAPQTLPAGEDPLEAEQAETLPPPALPEEENLVLDHPLTALEIGSLLVPGDQLGQGWQPASVLDLTQPYPGLPDWCGDTYGSCWTGFPGGISSGAELRLVREGVELGQVAFLYYQDLEEIEALFQLYSAKWSEAERNTDPAANEIWLHFYNIYDREVLGEKWLHQVGYSLYDLPGEAAGEGRPDQELLRVNILSVRCHGFLHVEVRFPVQAAWNSSDDNHQPRVKEQEEQFDRVYQYARSLDQRLAPIACSE